GADEHVALGQPHGRPLVGLDLDDRDPTRRPTERLGLLASLALAFALALARAVVRDQVARAADHEERDQQGEGRSEQSDAAHARSVSQGRLRWGPAALAARSRPAAVHAVARE